LAVGTLLEIDPKAAHRVVDRGEDAHRVFVRIFADEFFVNLEDAFELLPEKVFRKVRDVEVHLELVLAALRVEDAFAFVEALEEELTTGDVAWNEVAVARVLRLEEVVALLLRDIASASLLFRIFRNPDATALTTYAFGNESQLVRGGN